MKALLHPVPIACLIIAIVGGVTGNVPMVILGMIAGIASVGLLSARHAQLAGPTEELSSDSRILLKPVTKLVRDIEELVATNKDSQTLRLLGPDAIKEAKSLESLVTKSLLARDKMVKTLRGRAVAEKEIGEARMRHEFAKGQEKASLEAAIAARTEELKHYDQIERAVKHIELGVTQSEAVLAEMRARLALSASKEDASPEVESELREALGRIKTLSVTYEEADQLLRG